MNNKIVLIAAGAMSLVSLVGGTAVALNATDPAKQQNEVVQFESASNDYSTPTAPSTDGTIVPSTVAPTTVPAPVPVPSTVPAQPVTTATSQPPAKAVAPVPTTAAPAPTTTTTVDIKSQIQAKWQSSGAAGAFAIIKVDINAGCNTASLCQGQIDHENDFSSKIVGMKSVDYDFYVAAMAASDPLAEAHGKMVDCALNGTGNSSECRQAKTDASVAYGKFVSFLRTYGINS